MYQNERSTSLLQDCFGPSTVGQGRTTTCVTKVTLTGHTLIESFEGERGEYNENMVLSLRPLEQQYDQLKIDTLFLFLQPHILNRLNQYKFIFSMLNIYFCVTFRV